MYIYTCIYIRTCTCIVYIHIHVQTLIRQMNSAFGETRTIPKREKVHTCTTITTCTYMYIHVHVQGSYLAVRYDTLKPALRFSNYFLITAYNNIKIIIMIIMLEI